MEELRHIILCTCVCNFGKLVKLKQNNGETTQLASWEKKKKKANRDCKKMPSISCIFSDWIFQPGIQLWMKLLPLAAGGLTSLLWVSPGGDTVACHRGPPPTDLNKANQTVDYVTHPLSSLKPNHLSVLFLPTSKHPVIAWPWVVTFLLQKKIQQYTVWILMVCLKA